MYRSSFQFVSKEVTLQASAFYEVREFQLAADVLEKDPETPGAMVTDIVSLEDMPPMFEALRQRRAKGG